MPAIKKLLLFITIILAFQSCKTSSIITEKPVEKYAEFNYNPVPSTISLPVEMKVSALEAMINRKLTGLLYADTSLDNNGGDNLMVKAWKKEDFTIKYENNQLVYRIPLKLWIKAGWKVSKLGITLSDYKELNAEIALKFKTTFYLNKDWSITTFTSSNEHESNALKINFAGGYIVFF